MITEFNEIKYKEYTFVLQECIEMKVTYKDDMLIGYNDEFDLWISNDNIKTLKKQFQEYFYYLWREYCMEESRNLSEPGRKLKHMIKSYVSRVVIDYKE